jgi:uncharacterized protein DUF4129
MRLARQRAAVPIVAVAALLALVGAASSRPLGGGAAAPSLPILPLLFVVGAGSVAAAALAWSSLRRRKRLLVAPDVSGYGETIRAGPLTTALAALVPLTVLAIYISIGTSGHHRTVAPAPDFTTHPAAAPERQKPATDASKGAAALAAGVAAGLVGLAAFVALRRRPARPGPFEPRAAVAAGARDAVAAIAIPADPRAAVLAAYARMEAALDSVGLTRRASEAPREYLGRLDTALRGGRAPAARLTALFERARFSDHPVGEDVRADALGALQDLRSELEEPA